ncbi:ABC transporter permease [Nitrosomonadales bacterium]|nr:ABC transporter permease [Nitrosomonadales bacterium]
MNKLVLFIAFFWLIGITIKLLFGFDSNQMVFSEILIEPNYSSWLGRDDYGRDIFHRLIDGFINSFEIIFLVTIISSFIGVLIGVIAGYFGGKLDQFVRYLTTLFMAFPGILLAIAFAAILSPGKANLIFALSIGGWVGYARLARAQTVLIKNLDFVKASESMGSSNKKIIVNHVLPSLKTPLIVEATYAVASLIIAEASLSFIGLGLQAPAASWGGMMRDSVRFLLVSPHYALFVGLSIMSLVYCINFFGDYLNHKWDVTKN